MITASVMKELWKNFRNMKLSEFPYKKGKNSFHKNKFKIPSKNFIHLKIKVKNSCYQYQMISQIFLFIISLFLYLLYTIIYLFVILPFLFSFAFIFIIFSYQVRWGTIDDLRVWTAIFFFKWCSWQIMQVGL